jgi:acetyltransferase-like isoleucine patch superfamily enzyme
MRALLGRAVRRCRQAAFLARYRGQVSIGAECVIPFPSFRAHVRELRIGDYVRFGERVTLWGETFAFGDHFSCGNDVAITGGFASFSSGKFTGVASRVTFLLGKGHHRPHSLSNVAFGHIPQFDSRDWTARFDYADEAKTFCDVGNDVWIGMGALVLPNVRIGDGAVVSAGSVVVDDVPPYAIVGGHPAQVVAFRFKQTLIDELLALRWWDWPMARIKRNVALFTRNLTTASSLSGIEIVA